MSRHALTLLLSVIALVLPDPTSGQGTVTFSNRGASGSVMNGLTGQEAEVGTTFSVGLYFAQDGIVDEAQLNQVGSPIYLAYAPGIFYGGVSEAPVFPVGSFGMFQVRVWETAFGSSYEQAVANDDPQNGRLALVGKSGIIRVDTGDPTVLEPAASLIRGVAVVGTSLADGFILTVVPEPSAFLLLLLGLPGLMMFLRRGKVK